MKPLLLTEDALLHCGHGPGWAGMAPSQHWVRIEGRRVLVEPDPERRSIVGCPLQAPLKPCQHTLAVKEGYSALLRIDGRPICLDTVTGSTDGEPQETIRYSVLRSGQHFVSGED